MPTTSPSTENGRTIAGMYEAFGRGDVGHVLEQIDPNGRVGAHEVGRGAQRAVCPRVLVP